MSQSPDDDTTAGGIDVRMYSGDTFGESHDFDEATGNFRRDVRGEIVLINGPAKVAYELVRVLKTPVGDDPLRPDLGLDRDQLLGQQGDAAVKRAIQNAIGPDADPRVERLGMNDITVEQVEGDRENTRIRIRAVLAGEGNVLEFSADFEALLKGGRTSQ